jgi:transketolase C-terminal domain/subunit
LIKNANECNNNVIAVEDHYCNALGSLISSVVKDVHYLCVTDIPRSGKPEELRAKYGIDSEAIAKMVDQLT